MKRMVKVQLNQAFSTLSFKLAFGIGIIICLLHFVLEIIPEYASMQAYLNYDYMLKNPYSAYYMWLGESNVSIFSYAYFLAIPILSVLPFGTSFFQERKRGYANLICTRTNRKDYLFSKYIATFVSGGFVVVVPLIVQLLATACIFPLRTPEASESVLAITSVHLFGKLCYSNHLLYVMVSFVVLFVFSGLFATFALFATYTTDYHFVVMSIPFVLYLFLISVCNLLSKPSWFLNGMLNPGSGIVNGSVLLFQGLILLMPTLIRYLILGGKDDFL